MIAIIGVICLLQLIPTPSAQLLTLRDGKVGVNFAGFHADAGLGGLLTGNSAHGGLSASAGTPWGARSAAGIGGDLDGSASGIAFAAAQANDAIGASAQLGGSVGDHHHVGYTASESHADGKVAINQHDIVGGSEIQQQQPQHQQQPNYVQKIKPPKKYSLIKQDQNGATTELNGSISSTSTSNTIVNKPQVPVLIIKRHRLRVKRPRQNQRTVYITQPEQQQEQQQQQQQPTYVESPSDVKTPTDTRKFIKTVHSPAKSASDHIIRPQSNPVHAALQIPIGILQSLQSSLTGLVAPAPVVVQTKSTP